VTNLVATVLRQAVPPPPGKQRGCSQGWKAIDVAHCEVESPVAETVAEVAGTAKVE